MLANLVILSVFRDVLFKELKPEYYTYKIALGGNHYFLSKQV